MKKLLVLLLVFGLSSVAFGVRAETGFDPTATEQEPTNYAQGALIGQGSTNGDWAGAWLDNSGGRDNTGRFEVVAGGAPEDPDQHLQMFDADSSGYSTERDMDGWNENFTYSFTHRWNNDALVATCQHQFENASGSRPLNIKWEASGSFRVNDTGLLNWKSPAAPFKSPVGSDWVSVEVRGNMTTATFDLYWEKTDGTMGLVGTKIGFKDSAFSGDVVLYRMDAPKMNTTDGSGMDIDNIAITPEPATMLMLGLGGLALIRKKR